MKVRILLLALLYLTLSTCTTDNPSLKEGIIDYHVTYLDDPKDQPLINLLPGKVTVRFKDNSTATSIDGFMGLFSLRFISKATENKHYTLFRIMDKKYLYEANNNEPSFGYKDMGKINIRFLNETREISGFLCNKAIATSPEMNFTPLILFYTYEIQIKSPNTNNPFSEVDGVLMQFQVQLEGINMRFEAERVRRKPVSDDYFVIPEDFEKVDYTKMKDIMDQFNED